MKKIDFIFCILLFLLFSCSCVNKRERIKINKWVVVGNSITWHPINENWSGEWGMAATSKENDYVHLLDAVFKQNSDSSSFKISSAVNWEIDHNNFDLKYFDSFFDGDEELVIVRLGENPQDINNYEKNFTKLIRYLKGLSPNAKFIITDIFMSEAIYLKEKIAIQKRVCDQERCIWVPINHLDTKRNRNYVGNVVNDKVIENPTVANHPGDKGMEAIAEAIIDVLEDIE
ncbi:SGNH/GDSL hydrolase family protein [Dysgonomonas sp. 25]|uniref:SGNH/GDSL hydrolase family protein n=1 Tax=Dysgonomonas sp. 25 TaxID=2302933 RepID=UPI0013D67C41|nr:SGNH/GDSL hydrolase family protein [Dysgonomonas sp. 25]NDV68772.1 SGNH/GDSL hydrolase family protein [Dysgonomonas sp. 25]